MAVKTLTAEQIAEAEAKVREIDAEQARRAEENPPLSWLDEIRLLAPAERVEVVLSNGETVVVTEPKAGVSFAAVGRFNEAYLNLEPLFRAWFTVAEHMDGLGDRLMFCGSMLGKVPVPLLVSHGGAAVLRLLETVLDKPAGWADGLRISDIIQLGHALYRTLAWREWRDMVFFGKGLRAAAQ